VIKDFLFSAVVLLVFLDGIVLLIVPSTHFTLVNRWNALLGMSEPVKRDARSTLRWRLTGAVMVALCSYVLVATWHLLRTP
jgi:hypothetical protein